MRIMCMYISTGFFVTEKYSNGKVACEREAKRKVLILEFELNPSSVKITPHLLINYASTTKIITHQYLPYKINFGLIIYSTFCQRLVGWSPFLIWWVWGSNIFFCFVHKVSCCVKYITSFLFKLSGVEGYILTAEIGAIIYKGFIY